MPPLSVLPVPASASAAHDSPDGYQPTKPHEPGALESAAEPHGARGPDGTDDARNPQAPPRTLAVFDLDGTLVDLRLDFERVRWEIRALFLAAGIDRSFRPLLSTLEEECERLARDAPDRAEELRVAAWALVDAEEARRAPLCQPHPGAREVLARLVRAGVPLALYSNNSLEAVRQALRTAGIAPDLFFRIEARCGARSVKPAAAPLLSILEACPPPRPERVFMIGDHPVDMRSARLAADAGGVTPPTCTPPTWVPIALPRRPEEAPGLEAAGAWFVAADLEEAGDLILAPPGGVSLSLVLLAYNEAAAIQAAIVDARRFCRLYAPDYEIVVVDDGSRDETARLALASDEGDVRLVRHDRNLGMGAAMRSGYGTARKSMLAHLPGDRQVRPQALVRFLPLVRRDVVALSHYLEPPSGAQRRLLSFVFRLMVRVLGGLRVDFAGTYLFHRCWLERIPLDSLRSETFLLSFELLQRLSDEGCRFEAVRIHPFPRRDGASREVTLRRITRVLGEIARYRWRSFLG